MVQSVGVLLLGMIVGIFSTVLLLLSPGRAARRILWFVLHRSKAKSIFDDGYWCSVFYRKSKEGIIREHAHLLHFSRCFGLYHAAVVIGEYHHFQLIGKLSKGQYVTGNWFNDDPFRKYCGAFQFKLHNDGRTITGKWLGWNQAEAVNAGLWTMIRLDSLDLAALDIDARKVSLVDGRSRIDIEVARDRIIRAKFLERDIDRSLMWSEA